MVEHDGSAVAGRLARNLRRLRIARQLSLSELARATGMSKATLSSVESGRANPTVDTLASLAAALQVALVELLADLPEPEVTVVRAPRDAGIAERSLAALGPHAVLTLTELALDARELREREPGPAGSVAHLYVLQGRVLAGPVERVTELTRGDYAAFPADVPHQLETAGSAARALLMVGRPA